MKKMSITKTFEEFKDNIIENIPGLIALCITEMDSGISYVSHTNDPSFDPELASSFNLEVAKAKMRAIKTLELDEKIVDILINLENQIHIIDISKDGKYIIYLAVYTKQCNLGMTRALLGKFKQKLVS